MMIIANMGGTAGGGVLIPIAIIFYGFDTKNSIALSNSCVIFAALIRFIMNYRSAHPIKEHSVAIDYDYITVMLPVL